MKPNNANKQIKKLIPEMFLKSILLKNSFENHGFLLLGHDKQLQICPLRTTLFAQELPNLI